MLRQITFFRVSWVPKRCFGISNVSNAWTNMWNKVMEENLEKVGVERQNSKKGLEKNEHACSSEGVFVVSYCTVRLDLKVAGPTRKIPSQSKLKKVQK